MKRDSNIPNSKGEDSSLFDRVVPDGVKRGLENLLREGRLKNVLSEIKMPKEIVSHMMSQVDDTKKAALQIIGKEVRLFLEHTNLSEELAKLLTQISFEVKTEVRFIPNDKALPKTETKISLKKSDNREEDEEEEPTESEPQNKT